MSQIIFPTTLQTNGSECGTARPWSPAFRRRAAAWFNQRPEAIRLAVMPAAEQPSRQPEAIATGHVAPLTLSATGRRFRGKECDMTPSGMPLLRGRSGCLLHESTRRQAPACGSTPNPKARPRPAVAYRVCAAAASASGVIQDRSSPNHRRSACELICAALLASCRTPPRLPTWNEYLQMRSDRT
jgi:hypothetical protein